MLTLIARGNAAFAVPVRIFGLNYDVDNIRETVSCIGGEYVFPSSAIQMAISSTSTNDAYPSGTGVRTVEIHYLDDNYVLQEEEINLNGTTAVNTIATNILRVLKMHVTEAGSGSVAAGDIALKNTAGTTTYCQIPLGLNMSMDAVFTVPVNKTLYVNNWVFSISHPSGGRTGEFLLRATCHDETLSPVMNVIPTRQDGIFHVFGIGSVQDASFSMPLDPPMRFPEKVDIKIDVTSDTNQSNARCTTLLSGWLE